MNKTDADALIERLGHHGENRAGLLVLINPDGLAAIDLIQSLQAELDSVKAERDAGSEYLRSEVERADNNPRMRASILKHAICTHLQRKDNPDG